MKMKLTQILLILILTCSVFGQAGKDSLASGGRLNEGQRLVSPNGSHYLVMQADGNLCIYTSSDRFVWCSMVTKGGGSYLTMQADGNLVVYDRNNQAVWATETQAFFDAKYGTSEWKPVRAVLADDGTLGLYTGANKKVWSSAAGKINTGGTVNPGSNSIPIEGYTGPTTKRELIIALPFAKAQKLTVEVANDGKVIFQRDMVVGYISDFARNDSPSFDANSLIWSNSISPYFIKAGYGKTDLISAGSKVFDFASSTPPSYNANSGIWTNSTIPYVLPARHGKRDLILAGINEINSKTNLCLVPRTNETDYVEFISEKGHWSMVGRVGGRQEISIDQTESYVPMGTVAHEILHAAGFNHMQSREDRDGYVIINFGNIKLGMEHNFNRLTDKATNIGPYDFTSVMHYYAKAFSTNDRNTIDVKGGGDSSKMGQRDGVSPGDIAVVATIYAPGPCKPGGKKPDPKPTPTPAPTPITKPTPPPTTDNTGNIAIGKKAYQSNCSSREDCPDANKAIDGNTDGRFIVGSITNTGEDVYPWWEVDLGAVYDVSKIVIWNRTDECCWSWQQNFGVATGAADVIRTHQSNGGEMQTRRNPDGTMTNVLLNGSWRSDGNNEYNKLNQNIGPFSPWAANKTNYTVPINRKARYIQIYIRALEVGKLPGLSLAEVQVFGTPVK